MQPLTPLRGTTTAESESTDSKVVGSAVRSVVIWNVVGTAFAQIALAGIFILVAARLDPKIFGLFSLAAVVVDLIAGLGASAIVDALVQRQDFSKRRLASVTWMTLAIFTPIALLLAAGAQTYAAAIDAPGVAQMLEVLSLSLLLTPFVIAPTAVMRQRLDFKGIAVLGMVSSLAGMLAALATAYSPLFEWSLVAQRFVGAIVMIVLVSIRSRTASLPVFDWRSAAPVLKAAGHIFTAQGLCAAIPRATDLLVGIFFGVAAVGNLRVASRLSEMVVALLLNPISQMWVVLLSRVQDSESRLREVFLRLSRLLAIMALPGFVGLGLVAQHVVRIVLPPVYAPAGDMLAVLCLLGAFTPLTNPRNAILTAMQKFNRMVMFAAIELVATIVGIWVMSPLGPALSLLGSAFASITMLAIAGPYVLRNVHTSAKALIGAVMPAYLATGLMTVAVIAVSPLAPADNLLALMLKASVGATVYLGVLAIYFHRFILATVRARLVQA